MQAPSTRKQESRVFIRKCLVKYHLSRDGQTQKHQCRLAQLKRCQKDHHKHTQQMTKATKSPTSHEPGSQMVIANRILKKSNLVVNKVGPRTSPKQSNLQTSPNYSLPKLSTLLLSRKKKTLSILGISIRQSGTDTKKTLK